MVFSEATTALRRLRLCSYWVGPDAHRSDAAVTIFFLIFYCRSGATEELPWSRRSAIETSCIEQLCQPVPGVEHPRFHRVSRNTNDLGNFLDRFLVVVDEVNDLAMRRRQLRQAREQDFAALPRLHRDLRIVRRVLDALRCLFIPLLDRPTAQRRKRLVAAH